MKSANEPNTICKRDTCYLNWIAKHLPVLLFVLPVWHDSYMCVTCLVGMSDSCVRHDEIMWMKIESIHTYICIHVPIHVLIRIDQNLHKFTNDYLCICIVYVYVHTCVVEYMYMSMYTYMHTQIQVYIGITTCTYINTRMRIYHHGTCKRLCIYSYICMSH